MFGAKTRVLLPLIILLVVAGGMLSISVYYLFSAWMAYQRNDVSTAMYYSIIGGAGIAITFYTTFIARKRSIIKKETQSIVTTTVCPNCGYKTVKKFSKGDYVFKTGANCEKCNQPMLITSIFAEEPNKQSKQ
jgi:ribosomal protein L37AE/L43A